MTTNNSVDSPLSGTTGTGNFVGSTSPSLTTPNLGTPSAVNLSNATSLAAAALPSGTMFNFQEAQLTTQFTTTSTTMTALTGLSVSITPTSSSSKVLLRAVIQTGGSSGDCYFQFFNGTSAIGIGTSVGSRFACGASTGAAGGASMVTTVMEWLDSPATTSSITYSVQCAAQTGTLFINSSATDTNSAAFPRTSSSISVCEIHS